MRTMKGPERSLAAAAAVLSKPSLSHPQSGEDTQNGLDCKQQQQPQQQQGSHGRSWDGWVQGSMASSDDDERDEGEWDEDSEDMVLSGVWGERAWVCARVRVCLYKCVRVYMFMVVRGVCMCCTCVGLEGGGVMSWTRPITCTAHAGA